MLSAIVRPNNERSLSRSIDDQKMMCKQFCVNTTESYHFHFKTIEFTFMRGATKKTAEALMRKKKKKTTDTKVIGFDARADCSQHFFQRTRSRSTGIVCVCAFRFIYLLIFR